MEWSSERGAAALRSVMEAARGARVVLGYSAESVLIEIEGKNLSFIERHPIFPVSLDGRSQIGCQVMSKLPAELLRHIIDECALVLATVQGLTKEQFLADKVIVRAVERSVYIIGEATRNLPADLKTQYPSVEWKAIRGTRNILAHVYWGVDLDIIWDVVQHDLPILREQANSILDDLRHDG